MFKGKSFAAVALLVLVMFVAVGCGGREAEVEEPAVDTSAWGIDVPDWVISPPQSSDTIYGVANAESRQLNTAIRRARLRATDQLAGQLAQSIESFQEDYVQEMGEAADAEILSVFEQLTVRVVDEELHGVREVERAITRENGVFNAWVMVSANLDEVSRGFDEMERLETEFGREQAREQLRQRLDGDAVAPPE